MSPSFTVPVGSGRRFTQKGGEVEGIGAHGDSAVRGARPLLARAIPVELEAVAVGGGEVDRLADAVVGSALQADTRVEDPAHRRGERGLCWIADRDVIEAGVAGGRRRAAAALPGVEANVVMIAADRHERGLGAVPGDQLEAEDVAIEGQRPLEV